MQHVSEYKRTLASFPYLLAAALGVYHIFWWLTEKSQLEEEVFPFLFLSMSHIATLSSAGRSLKTLCVRKLHWVG